MSIGRYEHIIERVKKLEELYNLGKRVYKIKEFPKNINSKELKEKYKNLNFGEETKDYFYYSGRVLSIRSHGKIVFLDVYDENGKLQVILRKDFTENFKEKEYINRGDILGFYGKVIRTKRGEISLLVKNFEILAKCLREIPDLYFGVEDPETRFRQRYIDIMLNEKARKCIIIRNKVIKAIRDFLDSNGFIEIETPILQPIYGGATARPFETYYYSLKKKMYLRISPELYLKRLLVAGFEKVYEVSKCFRNEGIDKRHNPEFTQVEFYAAYWDYKKMMDFTIDLTKYIVESIYNKLEIEYMNKTLDFSKIEKWDVRKKLKEEIGIDVNEYDFEGLKDAVKNIIDKEEILKASSWGELVEILRENILEPLTKDKVVFMYIYPKDVCPLAKAKDSRWAERFEGFIDGMEFSNGYSELNDPIEQYLRFKEQEKLREKAVKEGKLSEHHPMDKDFVRALEYGMPPAAGSSIGIERISMFLANVDSIREVISFPTLRGEEKIENVPEIYKDILKFYEGSDT